MTSFKRFKNVKNIPGPDGERLKRLSLKVDSENIPLVKYWQNRFAEGAIELIESVDDVGKEVEEKKEISKSRTSSKIETTKPKPKIDEDPDNSSTAKEEK